MLVVLFCCCCLTRVGAASTHTQVRWDQMPKGCVSFDSGVLFVLVNVGVLHDDCVGGAAAAAGTTRIGAASTHTQVLSDQMPKGYVSFDSGVLLVLVSLEVFYDDGAVVAAAALPALVLRRPTRKSSGTRCPRAT